MQKVFSKGVYENKNFELLENPLKVHVHCPMKVSKRDSFQENLRKPHVSDVS